MVYEQIPILLGYEKDKFDIVTDYKDFTWLEPNGVKININLDNDTPYMSDFEKKYHFISEKEINNIISNNRELFLLGEDINLEYEWKVGDICYFEYKIYYISEMFDDRITGCSDGYGGTNGHYLNDRCVKISPKSMRASYNVCFYYDWILEKSNDIKKDGYLVNFPDVHEILIELWLNILNDVNGEQDKLNEFGESVISAIKKSDYNMTYNGVNIFLEMGIPLSVANEINLLEDGNVIDEN